MNKIRTTSIPLFQKLMAYSSIYANLQKCSAEINSISEHLAQIDDFGILDSQNQIALINEDSEVEYKQAILDIEKNLEQYNKDLNDTVFNHKDNLKLIDEYNEDIHDLTNQKLQIEEQISSRIKKQSYLEGIHAMSSEQVSRYTIKYTSIDIIFTFL